MIQLLPPPNSRIRSSVAVCDALHDCQRSIASYTRQAISEDTVRYIAEKLITTRRDEKLRATVYELNAVVMSAEEYREAIEYAYVCGRRDEARRHGA